MEFWDTGVLIWYAFVRSCTQPIHSIRSCRRHKAVSQRSAAPAATAYDTDLDPRLNPDLATAAGSETIDPRLNPDLRGGEPRLKTDLSRLDSLRDGGAVREGSSGEHTVHIGREALTTSW